MVKTGLKSRTVDVSHFSSGKANQKPKFSRLVIRVLEARQLLAADVETGKSDPVCFVWCGYSNEKVTPSQVTESGLALKGASLIAEIEGAGEGFKATDEEGIASTGANEEETNPSKGRVLMTSVCPETTDPIWDEDVVYPLDIDAMMNLRDMRCEIYVRDEDLDGNGNITFDELGMLNLSLSDVLSNSPRVMSTSVAVSSKWYTLSKTPGMSHVDGRIKLTVTLILGEDDLPKILEMLSSQEWDVPSTVNEANKVGGVAALLYKALHGKLPPKRETDGAGSNQSVISTRTPLSMRSRDGHGRTGRPTSRERAYRSGSYAVGLPNRRRNRDDEFKLTHPNNDDSSICSGAPSEIGDGFSILPFPDGGDGLVPPPMMDVLEEEEEMEEDELYVRPAPVKESSVVTDLVIEQSAPIDNQPIEGEPNSEVVNSEVVNSEVDDVQPETVINDVVEHQLDVFPTELQIETDNNSTQQTTKKTSPAVIIARNKQKPTIPSKSQADRLAEAAAAGSKAATKARKDNGIDMPENLPPLTEYESSVAANLSDMNLVAGSGSAVARILRELHEQREFLHTNLQKMATSTEKNFHKVADRLGRMEEELEATQGGTKNRTRRTLSAKVRRNGRNIDDEDEEEIVRRPGSATRRRGDPSSPPRRPGSGIGSRRGGPSDFSKFRNNRQREIYNGGGGGITDPDVQFVYRGNDGSITAARVSSPERGATVSFAPSPVASEPAQYPGVANATYPPPVASSATFPPLNSGNNGHTPYSTLPRPLENLPYFPPPTHQAAVDPVMNREFVELLDRGALEDVASLLESSAPRPELLAVSTRTRLFDVIATLLLQGRHVDRCLVWIVALNRNGANNMNADGTRKLSGLFTELTAHTQRDLHDALKVLSNEPSKRGMMATLLISQLSPNRHRR